jgi:hypothetical protein
MRSLNAEVGLAGGDEEGGGGRRRWVAAPRTKMAQDGSGGFLGGEDLGEQVNVAMKGTDGRRGLSRLSGKW